MLRKWTKSSENVLKGEIVRKTIVQKVWRSVLKFEKVCKSMDIYERQS